MSLAAGGRLGPYEIVAPLGAGGMGEVYRARDTRLGREVAIKVLPAERMADEGRRARFVQEARAASALNHPHIVTIYEIESAQGVDFIVMELVRGKTLDALIPRHGMRLGEVLRVAIPLADALAAAHGAGIVHRDLKPANVMVTPEGVAKVLDFGLAKLTQAEEAEGEEATTLDAQARLSRPGTVAGTPAYMSPEQASGRPVDARSDVFSFGAVLYEMVTGRRPFGGDSTAEMLACLLKEQPKPPSDVVPDVPRDLERIILRCLRKEPERRFHNMLDVKVDLQEVKESDSQAGAHGTVARQRSRRGRLAWIAAGVVALTVAAAAALWHLRRSELPTPHLVQLTWAGQDYAGTFSPDGNQIAYSSEGEIWLKIVGEGETRRLTTDPANEVCPAWSPDGKQIAFVRFAAGTSAGAIYLVSPLGGPERRLSAFQTGSQLSWSPDARWLAASRPCATGEPASDSGGIHLIAVGGGDARAVTLPKPPSCDRDPTFSPDGRALAYVACPETTSACDVYVLPLDSDLRPRAAARRLTRQRAWISGLAWTRDGHSIVYGTVGGEHYLWRIRVDGSSPPQRVELAGPRAAWPFTVAGRDRLGFTQSSYDVDIYRLRVGANTVTPLITSTAIDEQPQYSPDAQRIAFESYREGGTDAVWLADADGSTPTRLTRGPGRPQGSPRWSPDGRTIAFDAQAEDGHWDVWTIGADGSSLRQMTRHVGDHGPSSWSRDGHWIYFSSDHSGRREVWRVPALGGTEEQVTSGGGYLPFESPDGRTLYYKREQEGDSPLLARPTAGGEERTVIKCIPWWIGYAIGPEGVFHLDCNSSGPDNSLRALRHWDAGTGQDRLIAMLDAGTRGLSVSSDGRSILFTHIKDTLDLTMIENFR